MTHDEGPLKIYKVKNTAATGDMPAAGRVLLSEEYFGDLTVGVSRYYTALANNEKIDRLVEIWPVPGLNTSCTVRIENDMYIVRQVQDTVNEDGLKVQAIALERTDDSGECE